MHEEALGSAPQIVNELPLLCREVGVLGEHLLLVDGELELFTEVLHLVYLALNTGQLTGLQTDKEPANGQHERFNLALELDQELLFERHNELEEAAKDVE